MAVKRIRLSFLLSGRGSTLENLLKNIRSGSVNADVVQVISSRSKAGGLDIARREDIPYAIIRRKDYPDIRSFSDAITVKLDEAAPDYVIFGGFLCRYLLPESYRNRIINVHPALIPSFCGKGMFGENVHRAVIEYGVKITGCTVHFVDEEYDHGPIIAQSTVRVYPGDDTKRLAARVIRAERKLLPQVIQWLAEGRVRLDGRTVIIDHPIGKGQQ